MRHDAVWAENRMHDPTCAAPQVLDFGGVIWGPATNQIRVLPPLGADRVSAAISINDRGQAAGGSGVCALPTGPSISKHAVMWERGTVRDLGSFGGAFNNFAYAIYDLGEVVGQLDLPGNIESHALLWSKERSLRDLGTFPGDVSSNAVSINNDGTVVGGSCDASGNCRNVLWFHGAIVDFDALVGNTPVQALGLNDINDKGEVVGFAFDRSARTHQSNVPEVQIALLVRFAAKFNEASA